MKIIGVDPGTVKTGWGVIESGESATAVLGYGVVEAGKRTVLPLRLEEIYKGLKKLCRQFRPRIMVTEDIFFSKNVKSAIRIGEVRGVIILLAAQSNLRVHTYSPATIKHSVTGSGRASKVQIQEMVKRILHLKELPPEDASDALAMALCHAHTL